MVDLVDDNEKWDLNLLSRIFNEDNIIEITIIYPSRAAHGDDVCL